VGDVKRGRQLDGWCRRRHKLIFFRLVVLFVGALINLTVGIKPLLINKKRDKNGIIPNKNGIP
jgi:hypothetical protein